MNSVAKLKAVPSARERLAEAKSQLATLNDQVAALQQRAADADAVKLTAELLKAELKELAFSAFIDGAADTAVINEKRAEYSAARDRAAAIGVVAAELEGVNSLVGRAASDAAVALVAVIAEQVDRLGEALHEAETRALLLRNGLEALTVAVKIRANRPGQDIFTPLSLRAETWLDYGVSQQSSQSAKRAIRDRGAAYAGRWASFLEDLERDPSHHIADPEI